MLTTREKIGFLIYFSKRVLAPQTEEPARQAECKVSGGKPSALVAELRALKFWQLRKRALAEGVDEADIEEAEDSPEGGGNSSHISSRRGRAFSVRLGLAIFSFECFPILFLVLQRSKLWIEYTSGAVFCLAEQP